MKAKLMYNKDGVDKIDNVIVHILRDSKGNKYFDNNNNYIQVVISDTSDHIHLDFPSIDM